jgi:peptidoglycan/LPS O-acetylase OafA/YrhL
MILAVILLGVYGLLISLDIKHGFQGYYMLAIGCLLALLLNEEKSYARFQALVNSTFGPAIIVLIFAAVYVYRVQFEPFIIAIYPVAVAALIGLAVIGNGKVTAFLEIRAFRFVGLISYGIYLIHILAINAVQMVIEPGSGSLAITTLIFLCSVGLSIFAAWLMYLTIERPCIHYGRKLSRAVKRPAPSELASENG